MASEASPGAGFCVGIKSKGAASGGGRRKPRAAGSARPRRPAVAPAKKGATPEAPAGGDDSTISTSLNQGKSGTAAHMSGRVEAPSGGGDRANSRLPRPVAPGTHAGGGQDCSGAEMRWLWQLTTTAAGKSQPSLEQAHGEWLGWEDAHEKDLALALMSAVRKGQIPNTAFLLSVGAEVNVRIADTSVGRSLKHREPDAFQKDGNPPIIEAAMRGHWDIVLMLARAGADLTVKSCGWWLNDTVLDLAADFAEFRDFRLEYDGQTTMGEVVKELISRGAPMNAANGGGFTPLFRAGYACNARFVKILCKAGADPSAASDAGSTPLHAMGSGLEKGEVPGTPSLQIGRTLIAAGANVNAVTSSGESVLCAVLKGGAHEDERMEEMLQVVDLLLDAGAKPCDASMVWAARLGQHDHLATMLAAGGNPNAKDSNTLSIILETGPLLNYVLTQAHESTDYPRKLAAHLRMALVLVHAGANVTATDQDGDTPLELVCRLESGEHDGRVSDLVDALIARGAPVNVGGGRLTPLVVATRKVNVLLVEQLIRCGADLSILIETLPNLKRHTRATYATDKHRALVRVLTQALGVTQPPTALVKYFGREVCERAMELGTGLAVPPMRLWSIGTHADLAPSRRAVVRCVFFVANRLRGTELALPTEMWHHVLERVSRWKLGHDVMKPMDARKRDRADFWNETDSDSESLYLGPHHMP